VQPMLRFESQPGVIVTDKFTASVIEPDPKSEVGPQRNQVQIAIAIDIERQDAGHGAISTAAQSLRLIALRGMKEGRSILRRNQAVTRDSVASLCRIAETERIGRRESGSGSVESSRANYDAKEQQQGQPGRGRTDDALANPEVQLRSSNPLPGVYTESACPAASTQAGQGPRLRLVTTSVLQSRWPRHMQTSAPEKGKEAVLEVVAPDGARNVVRITDSPFLIGRGGETGNHLNLNDRRISRVGVAIVRKGNQYWLEDRGQRWGMFVNGEKVQTCALGEGSQITFGLTDSYELIFHSSEGDTSIQDIFTRIEGMSKTKTESESLPGGLRKLNMLLEATMLLQAQLPLESVLGTMLDHAVSVTDADRGVLLEPDGAGGFKVRVGRGRGGVRVPPESLVPSQTAMRQALDRRRSVITEDMERADLKLQAAQSVVAQRLRAVVAIPLYAMPLATSTETRVDNQRGELLGLIYLDSRRPAAFSKLDRQILDALAMEAGGILDNARLVERERQRQRLDQELNIARNVQQALLPQGFRDFPHAVATGINLPSLSVGGDYFDIFSMEDGRTGFLIADVSGKGLGAALLSTMLQGALSAMTIGVDPGRLMEHLNSYLCAHSDVEKYATMFFGVLDSKGHLDFINAGHLPPLILRHNQIVEPFHDNSFPVGLIPGAEYRVSSVTLEENDTLVLFSDGVTEAMDPEQEMFGRTGLLEALKNQHDPPLDQLQKTILDAVEAFTRGASQADDITVLLVRYRAASAGAPPPKAAGA
jgi:sigma-B regulation protein RsbU (phosphoserine phosphatase)